MKFDGVDDDEEVVRWMPLSFAGSAGTSVRGVFTPAPGRTRRRAVAEWSQLADQCGFPVAGGDLVAGVTTTRRLHVWRPQFWIARPGRHAGWFPLARIAQVGVTRHGLTTRITLLIDDGTMLGFESMRSRRIRAFADSLRGDPSAPVA